jgi:predicted phage-related endonuclease
MSVVEERESYAISRMSGLGGGDIAAVLGMSPWRRAIDVWESKVRPESVPELDKECLFWGVALEPIIRERYAIKFGVEVVAPKDIAPLFPNSKPWRDQTVVVGREPWMLGTADGWIPSVQSGLEVKNVGRKTDDWGEEGSDEIPAHYVIQTSWYNEVYDARGWNTAPLFSGNTLAQYRVPRDIQFGHDMLDAARSFWYDNVLKQVEPAIDESENYGRYLARKFSLNTGTVINNPSREILDWTARMKLADDAEKVAAAEKQLANNELRALIGDAKSARTPFGTIGWVRPQERLVTDWEKAFNLLADRTHADLNTLKGMTIDDCTEPKQNDPYLRAWWKK